MKAILARRSVRRYTSEPVEDKLVHDLLEAAMAAPSAGDERPWEFIVLRERTVLDAIPAIHPYAQMAREAPLAIVVCGDLQKQKYPGFWVQDCSAATENLLLAVTDAGLGAVWCGIYPLDERVEAFRKLLGTPPHIVPFALVPIGRPAEKKAPARRYDAARVHHDKW
ncbi:MAG: nitroreductase family protein [Candidatus Brocadiia bacterium]